MLFIKMNGIGNDYIFIIDLAKKYKNLPKLAKQLSQREYFIGSDGLVVIGKDEKYYTMDIYNSDGSRANMCGNAIRCVAKYLYDSRRINKKKFEIKTLSGLKTVKVFILNNEVDSVEVDMGTPYEFDYVNTTALDITAIDIGNRHLVVLTDDIDRDFYLGKLLQDTVIGGINVEFVKLKSRTEIEIRVYERGSGETLACGTGATAAAYAMYKKELVSENVKCQLRGGVLDITIKDGGTFMKGKAAYNFIGHIPTNIIEKL